MEIAAYQIKKAEDIVAWLSTPEEVDQETIRQVVGNAIQKLSPEKQEDYSRQFKTLSPARQAEIMRWVHAGGQLPSIEQAHVTEVTTTIVSTSTDIVSVSESPVVEDGHRTEDPPHISEVDPSQTVSQIAEVAQVDPPHISEVDPSQTVPQAEKVEPTVTEEPPSANVEKTRTESNTAAELQKLCNEEDVSVNQPSTQPETSQKSDSQDSVIPSSQPVPDEAPLTQDPSNVDESQDDLFSVETPKVVRITEGLLEDEESKLADHKRKESEDKEEHHEDESAAKKIKETEQ